ncbi:hypothetical protein ACFX2I_009286 [Malus domestica]
MMRFLEVEQPWMFQNNMVLEVDRAHGVPAIYALYYGDAITYFVEELNALEVVVDDSGASKMIAVQCSTSWQHHHQFPYPQSPEQPRNPQFSPYLTKRLAPATDSALNDSLDWDEFNDSAAMQSKEELDSGSRRPIFEPDPFKPNPPSTLTLRPWTTPFWRSRRSSIQAPGISKDD